MELDYLKDLWQQQNKAQNYETEDLLKMLNSSSMSYVKYIFWVSVAEFIIMIGINVFSTFNLHQSDHFFALFKKYHIPFSQNMVEVYDCYFMGFNFFTLVISFVFIYLFYTAYKNIRIESSLKLFIQQIVKVKKTVNLFISINLVFIMLTSLIFLIYPIYLLFADIIALNREVYMLIASLVFVIILSVLLLYLYYRLIYGIILNKLTKNLKQLNQLSQ